jgi:hypothetical protein
VLIVVHHTNSKGTTYYLHRTVTPLKNGREQPIFSFGKTADHAHALDAVPAGYAVSEASSGLPVRKKQAAS